MKAKAILIVGSLVAFILLIVMAFLVGSWVKGEDFSWLALLEIVFDIAVLWFLYREYQKMPRD